MSAAADVVNGLACEWCGAWLNDKSGRPLVSTGKAHGHPVVCNACWDVATEAERKTVVREYLGGNR